MDDGPWHDQRTDYLAPIYPVLFARRTVALAERARRPWHIHAYAIVLGVRWFSITGPVVLTILLPRDTTPIPTSFRPDQTSISDKFNGPLPQIALRPLRLA